MKYRALAPWVNGNESVTPEQYYSNNIPNFEQGIYISIDLADNFYNADKIQMGNLEESWQKTREYIEKACKIANLGKENGYDLDHEEKQWILDELGEPPESSYNIYFITIKNNEEESLVYIGISDTKLNRFRNGHKIALKLHNSKFYDYEKKIYFGTIMMIADNKYLPLEFIRPLSIAKQYLKDIEAILIRCMNPSLNTRKEKEKIIINGNIIFESHLKEGVFPFCVVL